MRLSSTLVGNRAVRRHNNKHDIYSPVKRIQAHGKSDSAGKNRRLCVVVALVMFGVCCNAQAKKIYKWVDEKDVTHYGESAPPNIGMAHEIHIPKTPAVDAAVNTRKERTERLLDTYKQERAEKKETRQAAAEERSEREKNCKKAKEN